MFTYDANGNLVLMENSTAGVGKTVTWTSYNYPSRVEQGGNVVTFKYGPNRQRYSEKIYSGGLLERHSITVNGHFEKVEEDGVVTYKHYIRAGARVIAIHDRKSDGQHATHYLHRDHLGSVDTITDEDGNVETRTSFDAFGQRRLAVNWNDGFPTSTELEAIRDITTRGYTGHQMIDATNLIHMGGRIYDPELGQFLSPDPNIPNPLSTQGFNRYSYVYNNPLSHTDPSGFVPRRNQPLKSLGWGFWGVGASWGGSSSSFMATMISSDQVWAMMSEVHSAVMGVLALAMNDVIAKTANTAFSSLPFASMASQTISQRLAAHQGGVNTSSSDWVNPTNGEVRGCDGRGCGHYGASRGNRDHEGADYVAAVGHEVLAVNGGEVTKIGYPYGDDLSYRYIEITTSDGYVIRMMYVSPAGNIAIGVQVQSGQNIGMAQNLTTRYPGITNHVHVEIRINNQDINPQTLIPRP